MTNERCTVDAVHPYFFLIDRANGFLSSELDWRMRSGDIGLMCEHDVHIVARSAGIPTGGMRGR
jgi:hypothetical protein